MSVWGCLERGQAPKGGGSAADGGGGLDEPSPFSSCSWQPPEAPPSFPKDCQGSWTTVQVPGHPQPCPLMCRAGCGNCPAARVIIQPFLL